MTYVKCLKYFIDLIFAMTFVLQKNKQVPEIPVEDKEGVQEPLSELSEHEISSIQAKAAKLLEADCQAYRQGNFEIV